MIIPFDGEEKKITQNNIGSYGLLLFLAAFRKLDFYHADEFDPFRYTPIPLYDFRYYSDFCFTAASFATIHDS